MPTQSVARCLRDIQAGRVAASYWVEGEEEFLKRRIVSALREKLSEGSPALQVDRLDAGEEPPEEGTPIGVAVAQALGTGGLFSDSRLIIVSRAESLSGDDALTVSHCLGAVPDGACLVLVAEADPRKGGRAATVAERVAVRVPCPSPTAEECAAWVERRAASLGKRIGREVAARLVEVIGCSLGLLDQELRKLAAFAGDQGEIGEEMLDRVVFGRRYSTRELQDALSRGDPAACLRILHGLLVGRARPEFILGAVGGWMRNRMGPSRARKAWPRLRQADREIKRGLTSPELALELLLLEITRAAPSA